jgi:hypothetical protein
MKTNRALILMASLVVTTLGVAALAQQDSGRPNPTPRPETPSVSPGPGGAGYVTDYGATPYFPRNHQENGVYSVSGYWTLSPGEADLAHQGDELVKQLGEAKSDTDRDKVKTKLSEILEKQFDQRQKRHEKEIEGLEAQIKKLKDLVEKRRENRREIISRRLDQILRDSQGLGW